jgi:hypothetical protein
VNRRRQPTYDSAYRAFESAAERRRSASSTLSEALAAAVEVLPEYDAAGAEYDRALARARELCPAGVEFELPANADEVEFPDSVDRLREVLAAGPRRPLATEALQFAAARRAREGASPPRPRCSHGGQLPPSREPGQRTARGRA